MREDEIRKRMYESILTKEQLQDLRDEANAETRRQETKPRLERLLENYMGILKDAYYQERQRRRV